MDCKRVEQWVASADKVSAIVRITIIMKYDPIKCKFCIFKSKHNVIFSFLKL